jgi:hypothetical protein
MTDSPRPRDESELVELIRSIDVTAPPRLHDRVEALVAGRERTARGGVAIAGLRLRLGAAATALAAAAAGLTIALSGSGSAALSLAQASAATLRPATMAAPHESRSEDGTLTAAVDGVPFPYWQDHFHWRSTGSRSDELAGRRTLTVFYSDSRGDSVGYSILAGTAPRLHDQGQVHWRGGSPYSLGRAGGAEVVTWKRDGHLCVIAGYGVSGAQLLALASWDEHSASA